MPRHRSDGKHKADFAADWNDDERLHKRLSKALIHIRDLNGLMNKELAVRLKVTEGYMSQVLHGRRDVRLSMLNRMSKEFGIEAYELLEDKWGEGEPRRRRAKSSRKRGEAA
ncbi:MAG: helix-turn-helix domain-containing protein [Rhizobiaceae bacterium]|nr:helix-turn-helix domain-containing protein [Rhizobiaceae bacterium]